MKKILVPTDFSDNAKQAVQYALAFAKHSKQSVHLVHAVAASKKAGHFSGIENLVLTEKQAELHSVLTALKSNEAADVELTAAIQQDYVVDAIIKEADKVKADLIIMGTEGASGLEKWIVGSTTNSLIKNTKLPVLAIPTQQKTFAFSKVCLGLDLSKAVDVTPLQPLFDLCKIFNAQLDLVSVVTELKNATVTIHSSLEEVLKAQKINYRAYQTVAKQSSEIDDAILLFAKDAKADVIAILNQSNQRSWWQNLFHSSVSEEIAYQSTLPLLVLQS